MPTHFMQTPDGDRPYAYCSECGWAAVYQTQEKADAADRDHRHNNQGDTRYDDDGEPVTPLSERT